jgi:putative ABC transport system permease protein
MVKTLDKKLLRELGQNRGLLAAIISIVVVGVTCYVAMQSAYRNLDSARQHYYRQCRMSDFWIDLEKLPTSELNRLSHLDPNWELQGRIQFLCLVDLPEANVPINGLVVSAPLSPQKSQNRLQLKSGDFFSSGDAREVILNDAFARHHHFRPGDTITLLIHQKQQKLLITGTAISSEFTYLLGPGAVMPDPGSFGVFYLPQKLVEQLYDYDGACNQVTGKWGPSSIPNPESLRNLENKLEDYGFVSTTELQQQTSNQFLVNEIAGLRSVATLIPFVFLAVAAVVLNVLVSRLVRKQQTLIGTLKAIGYPDLRILTHFLKLGLFVGLLGGGLGCLAGYGLSAGLTAVYRHYFEFPNLESEIFWQVHLAGCLASVGCAVLGCLQAARRAMSLQPATAMRPAAPAPIRQAAFEQWLPGWNVWHADWRLTIRNLWRQKTRTLTAIFSCSMGSGLLVAGLMMLASQNYLIDFQFFRTQRSHLNVRFNSEQNAEAIFEIQQLPHTQVVEPILEIAGDLRFQHRKETLAIQGLVPQAELTVPRSSHGSPLLIPDHGIILERRLAEKLGLRVGDLFEFTPKTGDRLPCQLTVTQISDGFLGLACYADIRYLSQLMHEPLVVTGVQLRVEGSPDEHLQLLAELRSRPQIQSVVSQQHLSKTLRETLLKNQSVMISTLIIFSGVIYFGSILNFLLVSLAERQREVATFRALGFTPLEIGQIFLRENLVTNGLGTLAGMPIGFGLISLTAWSFNNDLIRLPVVSPPWIWGATLVAGFIFGSFAQLVLLRQIQSDDFVDTLNMKE